MTEPHENRQGTSRGVVENTELLHRISKRLTDNIKARVQTLHAELTGN